MNDNDDNEDEEEDGNHEEYEDNGLDKREFTYLEDEDIFLSQSMHVDNFGTQNSTSID